MPLSLTTALRAHLDGEALSLATLWDVTRRDGVSFYFTDHDRELTFDGQTYHPGIGYNRTSVEDKADLSVDNMDVQGVLNGDFISRADVRAGLFDGAEVYIRVVDWTAPASGAIIRRRGWFGEVKQNDRDEFNVELRGLTQALSETLTEVYTPGCPVDLGSSRCGVPLEDAPARQDGTAYAVGDFYQVAPWTDYNWRVVTAGVTADDTTFDFSVYTVSASGVTVTDGTVEAVSVAQYGRTFVVKSMTDRKNFIIEVDEERMAADPRWFDGGTMRFDTGENAGVAREVKAADADSDGDVDVDIYLRFPFNVDVGDAGTLWPGCDKTMETCARRFGNGINFQGFPHIPGDTFMKNYPDAK